MPRTRAPSELDLPSYDDLIVPVFEALKALGGSGTVAEINQKVIESLGLSEEQVQYSHRGQGADTEIEYRLHWTRTYLKKYGLIDNSSRGVWALTANATDLDSIDPAEIVREVKKEFRNQQHKPIKPRGRPKRAQKGQRDLPQGLDDTNEEWRAEVLGLLTSIPPASFERLVQRILRESGFTQVVVTGRTNDGGIDGKGILRLGGLMSYAVVFQAKRWKNSVDSKHIRDFRGAMAGRAEKGLFVTTSSFTPDAIREATREGAPIVDTIDGDELIDRLKELQLGVQTTFVQTERIKVDPTWFENI